MSYKNYPLIKLINKNKSFNNLIFNKNNKKFINKMSEKNKDNISIFTDLDIMKIQKDRKREKLLQKKLDIVRKLYYRTR